MTFLELLEIFALLVGVAVATIWLAGKLYDIIAGEK